MHTPVFSLCYTYRCYVAMFKEERIMKAIWPWRREGARARGAQESYVLQDKFFSFVEGEARKRDP